MSFKINVALGSLLVILLAVIFVRFAGKFRADRERREHARQAQPQLAPVAPGVAAADSAQDHPAVADVTEVSDAAPAEEETTVAKQDDDVPSPPQDQARTAPAPDAAAAPDAGDPPTSLAATLSDTALPLEQREALLTETAGRRDAAALQAVIEVADARIYLSAMAVRALEKFRETALVPEAAAYLERRLGDPDSQIACEAMRAYASLLGEKAVDPIVAAIMANRVRPDGHEEVVAKAGVEALGEVASPRALPFLRDEARRIGEGIGLGTLNYGSLVVAALKNLGSPEGAAAIIAYADLLAARVPEDPLARKYFEEKIAEARFMGKQ